MVKKKAANIKNLREIFVNTKALGRWDVGGRRKSSPRVTFMQEPPLLVNPISRAFQEMKGLEVRLQIHSLT